MFSPVRLDALPPVPSVPATDEYAAQAMCGGAVDSPAAAGQITAAVRGRGS
ncbi:hypothetical protein ABIA35_001450 [Catenulispora sp. MAP12-49]|uniref:hypothetical protein n=1 Tax=Catenulispora sp. MAP12-49 TaxID=3156302 RepID=UPI0035145B51